MTQTGNPVMTVSWQRFLELGQTAMNRQADFSGWHQGRAWFALWALMPQAPELLALHARLVAELADLSIAPYLRQPHVSLAIAGFPNPNPSLPDEYSPPLLEQDLQALQGLALAPFELVWSQIHSFALAPYLAVELCPQLAALQQALHQAYPAPKPYVPHLTLGLYREAWCCRQVQARLQALAVAPGSCRIDSIALVAYRSDQLAGSLRTLGRFCLIGQQFEPVSSLFE